MRVVFMGTPRFAVPSLEALAARHDVCLVLTAPDRPVGRGRTVKSPPVKDVADRLGLRVLQPDTLDGRVLQEVRAARPDVGCVAAYGKILPAELIDIPRHGTLNVHASLLPRHRGAAPIERAILEGDAVTGVSIMRVEPTLDTGDVALSVEVPIGDMDSETLANVLAEEGARALLRVLDSIEDGSVSWTPQDDALATYAQKVTAEDVRLSPALTVDENARRVRASSRRAPARLVLDDSPAVVLEIRPAALTLAPGEVGTDGGLFLGAADGSFEVLRLRPQNRKEMPGDAFVCGLRGEGLARWSEA
ncbi:MAG: methionyl-tRNA formyltransferase [Coriobacteriia bacterium]